MNKVRMTICPDNKRDAVTLYQLIIEHVELTSTIHTDCWRGYNGLMGGGGGFRAHMTVNHSVHFVDPVTNGHTNNIDSCWRSLRHRLARGGIRRDKVDFIWWLDCDNRSADPFQDLTEDIKMMYPIH